MNYDESNFVQEVTLPSGGLLNPELAGGVVKQRCMMVADQKFLASSSTSGNQVQEIIQRTITEPKDFDVTKLTLPDTLYLLFKLRVLSYGSEYKYIARCPECGRKIEVPVDLSKVSVETLEEGYEEKMSVVLPHRGDTVYTKILTNEDNEALSKEIKRRKRKNPDDESAYVLRIVYSISKIKVASDKSEIKHPIDIERYVNSLTDLDASAIIATRDAVTFGIDPVVETICPDCNEEITVPLVMSGDFFRPSFARR